MDYWALIIRALFILVITQCTTSVVRILFPHWVVENPQVIFGLFGGPIIVGLTILLGFILLVPLLRRPDVTSREMWAQALIIGGALSNLSDRLIFGAVVDYIPFLNFSTFNLADALIILGAIYLVFATKKRPNPAD